MTPYVLSALVPGLIVWSNNDLSTNERVSYICFYILHHHPLYHINPTLTKVLLLCSAATEKNKSEN